jgi:uncharacterized protein (DUF342 family)
MQLELSVSDDKLKLFARVVPQSDSANAEVGELREELLKVTQESLIDEGVVKDIVAQLRQGKGCEGRRIAKGESPVLGRDGKLVWLVRRFRPGSGIDPNKELADFYNLGLFENIEVGKEVARVYKPTGGTAGIDVLGKPLTARPGKALNPRFDKSLQFKPNETHPEYQTLIAAVSGYAHEEGEKVTIRDTLVIENNLDYEMGHIDFIGNVRVGGDIQKGFHVKARGDIDVLGSVLGENQLTSGASITVKGFHQGGGDAHVKAGANYTVGIAHGVVAEAGGMITIKKEARDCNLRTVSAVIAPNAAIIGGSIWCVKGFEGRVLGNEMGVRTTIELRNELEVTAEYRALEEKIKKHEMALAALELHIGPYLQNRKRIPLLNAKFRMKITDLVGKFDYVQTSLDKLKDAVKRMKEAKPAEADSRVNVMEELHEGVVLSTSSYSLEIKESQKGPVSYRPMESLEKWVVVDYKPLLHG